MSERYDLRKLPVQENTGAKLKMVLSRSLIVAAVFALSAALGASVALAHKIGSHTQGEEPTGIPSVENCATLDWKKNSRCAAYDSTDYGWQVTNNCPRDIRVRWADNAYNRPIKRGEESSKPKSQQSSTVRPGETIKREVRCVDKAELEICIDYVYPPLAEHTEVDCKDFFD